MSNYEITVECCLLAGRLMIEGGAETYRAEDTMERMARSQHLIGSQSFVMPTGIMFSGNNNAPTRLMRVNNRMTDLEKVAMVNAVSRKLVDQQMTIEEAYDELRRIETEHKTFPFWLQIISAGITSGAFLLLLGFDSRDLLAAMMIGALGYVIATLVEKKTRVKFFAEFFAALVIGVAAYFTIYSGFGKNLDGLIIGSVIPLVPGLLITNAVRDLMAGHFVSGLSKGAEAFLTAFAIGAGVALVLSL